MEDHLFRSALQMNSEHEPGMDQSSDGSRIIRGLPTRADKPIAAFGSRGSRLRGPGSRWFTFRNRCRRNPFFSVLNRSGGPYGYCFSDNIPNDGAIAGAATPTPGATHNNTLRMMGFQQNYCFFNRYTGDIFL